MNFEDCNLVLDCMANCHSIFTMKDKNTEEIKLLGNPMEIQLVELVKANIE
jgi:hypothetical protein